jgi:hypothetical protein
VNRQPNYFATRPMNDKRNTNLGEFVCPIAAFSWDRIIFWSEESVEFLEEARKPKALHHLWRNRRN